MTINNKFEMKHGEKITIDKTNPKTRDCLNRLVDLHYESTNYLQIMLLGLYTNPKLTFPCKQCIKNVALQFKDIGSLIEELVDKK